MRSAAGASAYVVDLSPGVGRVAPRACLDTSDPTVDLAGTWPFRLASGLADVSEGFEAAEFDDSSFEPIPVPSCWQMIGVPEQPKYNPPQYTNVRYPFPIDPPHVPDSNPTGEYRRWFELPDDWPAGRTYLRFDGVDSCFAVWLNGVRLGDHKGSRLTAEFDATHALKPGSNIVAVRAHQYSSGSYLEGQDTWWLSGIFRAVTLRHIADSGITDVFVHADFDPATEEGILRIESDATATLWCEELALAGADPAGPHHLRAVTPWSAESPRLYHAVLRAGDQLVVLRIGFRRIEVVNGRILANGRRLVFKGVNRHDWSSDTGRTIGRAEMVRDIEIMKQHNINAVRTSHYPPSPQFLDLCDEYGLWVVEECDLETHGFLHAEWRNNPPVDPEWLPAMLDRMQRTVERDKNHPCVMMWSLGNESWSGPNLEAMAAWTKDRDPDRLLHYENDYEHIYTDVYSRMYPSHDEVAALGRGEEPPTAVGDHDAHRRALPVVLCEYAHAMGNGPGSLREYQDLFETYPRLHGGFIWEWMDQGIRQRRVPGDPTTEFYAYGGDFGEPVHDGNFIIDGLLFPDRTPSPALVQVKAVFAPIDIEIDALAGTVTIRKLSEFDLPRVGLRWSLEDDGEVITSGYFLDLPDFTAHRSMTVPLPEMGIAPCGERWLGVSAVLTKATSWADEGHELAFAQTLIDSTPRALPTSPPEQRERAARRRAHPAVLDLGPARFDRQTGRLLSVGDLEIASARVDLWRAPTDNDRAPDTPDKSVAAAWRLAGLDALHHRITDVVDGTDCLTVTTRIFPAGRDHGAEAVYEWFPTDDGAAITIALAVRPLGPWPCAWPKVGLRLVTPTVFDHVEWFGLGPQESYPDTAEAVRTGRFRSSVPELQTPYVYPQENGNRRDTRWAILTNDDQALRISGSPSFDLAVRPWAPEALTEATHTVDVRPDGMTYIHLDAAHHGIGSAACGPYPLPRYVLHPRHVTLTATLSV